jgi:hypothetical protein
MNPRTTALALVLATLAGCHYDHDEQHYDPYLHEVEPNDFAFQAQGIGPIAVGDRFLIRGHASDQGFDPFDGFAFKSVEPMDVEFALLADEPFDDFDVELFDPYTGDTIASWETSLNPETGVFSVQSFGVEFHLVVSSFVGSGGYTLEVRGAPITWLGVTAQERLAGEGRGRGTKRTTDGPRYGAPKVPPEEPPAAPRMRRTTVFVDPDTGETRIVEVRQLEASTESTDPR